MFLVTRKNVFDATCNNHNLYISQTSWKGLSFGLIFCDLCLGQSPRFLPSLVLEYRIDALFFASGGKKIVFLVTRKNVFDATC